jgi:hypothetical protein
MNSSPAIPFTHNDGGRSEAGYSDTTGDCFVRATSIASGLPYQYIYDLVRTEAAKERIHTKRRKGKRSSPREGVWRSTADRVLARLGFEKVSVMTIGSGCTTHLRSGEIPSQGRLIVNLSHHFAAVVDGVLMDLSDCSREGTRCVYSYYVNSIWGCAQVEEIDG